MTQQQTAKEFGNWYAAKMQLQAHERGVQHVAKRLRKQGVPVELAAALLARRIELDMTLEVA